VLEALKGKSTIYYNKPTKSDELARLLSKIEPKEQVYIFLDDIERSDKESIISTYRLLLLLKDYVSCEKIKIKMIK